MKSEHPLDHQASLGQVADREPQQESTSGDVEINISAERAKIMGSLNFDLQTVSDFERSFKFKQGSKAEPDSHSFEVNGHRIRFSGNIKSDFLVGVRIDELVISDNEQAWRVVNRFKPLIEALQYLTSLQGTANREKQKDKEKRLVDEVVS